ncbi:dissimilatory-type sulfite reductase subunit alpha [Pinisolibacter aquiterrae]|jgi:sulfite reductase alpha subunit|uniref:dissimilatory-type sulfite reductase subunit alpha n=1 Tax=Pinisolibacter aquiterrae TaxID=2815579 RepID=UPI001C3D68F5|nr:dissimilatory-type sulfite reductase subunit alpha [Pinisolibacter aquiterrae]MBV5264404.1 dissimilatory-type sulfite reductase subunit alpha [Pinisolibacter aquiterrae]MCC8234447.1 dissimilatory-type sulfite reductase subunit alpha [Pinisolibacter aquiterrae]
MSGVEDARDGAVSGAARETAQHPTPHLDQLETGPWPSFVTGLKRLRDSGGKQYAAMMNDLLGQLEHSYTNRLGYWKGGTVSVFGYGGGIIPRFSEVADKFPESKEFHTLRVQPPAGYHYTTDLLRNMCDIWEEHGSGLIALHGQSGDIMFQGCKTENVQKAFDALNEIGFDLGGAGPALRTSMSCVGHARCEMSMYDEVKAHRSVINEFLDEMHRPSFPYKFKFKFSGCPNDCVNAIHRADFAVIGTWRDDMKVDQEEVKAYVAKAGRKYTIDHVVAMCPTRALSLNDDDTLEVDNQSCVRCMHCINVMNKALAPGDDRGATILIGGKRSLKVGDLMGTMVVPFFDLKTDEDYESLVEFARSIMEFFTDNALEHERVGETIDRIGLPAFLKAVGIEPDPNMVKHPRTSSYVRTDDFTVEADKYFERKLHKAAE